MKTSANLRNSTISNSTTANISRRVGLGALAVFLGQGITMLGQVLVVPIFLWAWGAERYGEWLSLYAIVGYLTMLNFGMQTYVINRLNQAYTLRKIDEYNLILHSALKLFLALVCIGGVIAAAFYLLLPFERWLNFTSTTHLTTALVGILLSLQILGAIPMGLIGGTYRTFGELPRGQMIANVQRSLFFLLTALVLVLHGGLLEVAAVQLLPLIGIAVYVLIDLRRRHPEINIGISKADWRLAITFLGPSFFFFLMQVSAGFTFQGSILLVGAVVGPAAVAAYSVLRTLATLVRQIAGSINSVLWPELTSLEAITDYSRLRKVHSLLVKGSLALCATAAVFLHFEAKDIVSFWTGGRIVFDQTLMDLFLAYLVLLIPMIASSVFPAATNRHKKLAISYIVSRSLGLILAYLFSSLVIGFGLGARGVILGILIGEVLTVGWYVPAFTCHILGESIKRYWLSFVFRGVPIIALQYIGAWAINSLLQNWLMGFLGIGAWLFVVLLIGSYFLWLSQDEKAFLGRLGAKIYAKRFAFLQ